MVRAVKINKALQRVKKLLKTSLTHKDRQKISNMCYSVNNVCYGDGCGLLGGGLTEMVINAVFTEKVPSYKKFNKGEKDMIISNVPLSLKKISGRSNIALNWSKNKKIDDTANFTCHIMIINLKEGQWWKTGPNKPKYSIKHNNIIPSGIFLVDLKYCKKFVKLTKNNKTNKLIDSEELYCMLQHTINQNLYFEIPSPNKTHKFNILDAFSI